MNCAVLLGVVARRAAAAACSRGRSASSVFHLHEAGRGRERQPRAPRGATRTVVDADVAVGVALEVARDVERVAAQRGRVVQRVVAVAGALAADDDARFPVRRRASTAPAPCRTSPTASRASWPVTSLTVKPSRCAVAERRARRRACPATAARTRSPRTSRAPALPNGAATLPVHFVSDGRALVTLTRPPSVLRPNSALCGPRTNSICSTSSSSMLDELALSCGTPSM